MTLQSGAALNVDAPFAGDLDGQPQPQPKLLHSFIKLTLNLCPQKKRAPPSQQDGKASKKKKKSSLPPASAPKLPPDGVHEARRAEVERAFCPPL